MYRSLRLLSRSRRLLRARSAGATVSGEAATILRCAPDGARMVSGHLGLGLPGGDLHVRVSPVSLLAGPRLGARVHSHLPLGVLGAMGTAEGRAPAGVPVRLARPAPRLSLQRGPRP